MRFAIFASAVTALSFSASVSTAAVPSTLTPAQIVTALQGLTSKANNLQTPVGAITAENAALLLTGGGPLPAVVAGIQDLAVNSQGLAVLLQSAPDIPSGNPANSVIAAYQQFATALQQVLTVLNQRSTLITSPAVAAPLNAALQNLQTGVTNLFNQLTIRLTPAQAPPIAAPQSSLTQILSQLLTSVNNLLNGLNLSDLLGSLLGGGVSGGSTGNLLGNLPILGGGSTGLPALPFLNLPIQSGSVGGLNLGSLPVLGPLLSGLGLNVLPGGFGGGSGTGTVTSPLKGLLGGILAKRVEAY